MTGNVDRSARHKNTCAPRALTRAIEKTGRETPRTVDKRTPHAKAEARKVAHEIKMARLKIRRKREAAAPGGTMQSPNLVTSRADLLKAIALSRVEPGYLPHQGEREQERRRRR